MAYAVASDVIERSNISDLDGDRINTASLDNLIEDAESQINGYLSQRYDLDDIVANSFLRSLTVDIVLQRAAEILDLNIDSVLVQRLSTRYDNAIESLEKIRDGAVDLELNTRLAKPVAVQQSNLEDFPNDEFIGGTAKW